MDVQVRHRLADAVVHRHERALGAHCQLDRPGQKLGRGEQRPDPLRRKVRQRLEVLARNQQNVSVKQRPVIEERDCLVGLMHELRRLVSAYECAERARAFHSS